jgi:hypothetical protein
MLHPATFNIDSFGDNLFHGFTSGGDWVSHGLTPGADWNGFACPLFPFAEASRLAAINNKTEFAGRLTYDAAQDAFLFTQEGQDAKVDEPEVFGATVVEGQKFYAIGSCSWCWNDCSDTEEARFSADLVRELSEMKRLDMHMPDGALAMATDAAVIREYMDMKVSDAADLLIQLTHKP